MEKKTNTQTPFLKSVIDANVTDGLKNVFASGYVGSGTRVSEFERALELYLNTKTIVSTSSCTGALSIALQLAHVNHQTCVLTTPMTCAATNMPLLHLGASITWADIDPISGNISPDSIESCLKSNDEIKVVMIMDWGGVPCDYDRIRIITEKYGVKVVHDAAQSFGSEYSGKRNGMEADYTCYSFGPTKILSSVEGGAILIKEHDQVNEARKLQWYGIDRGKRNAFYFWDYEINKPGHRLISNDVFAEIGLFMLSKLQERIDYHRTICTTYTSGLSKINGIRLHNTTSEIVPNHWLFTILAENRNGLLKKLNEYGIHAAIPHKRNDKLNCFNKNDFKQELPGVEYFSNHYICLPIGPWVSMEETEMIIDIIKKGW